MAIISQVYFCLTIRVYELLNPFTVQTVVYDKSYYIEHFLISPIQYNAQDSERVKD